MGLYVGTLSCYKKKNRHYCGSWTTPYSYTVPLEPMHSAPDTTWTDTSINLFHFEDIVYYKIYGKVWTEESSTAPQITWDNRPQK